MMQFVIPVCLLLSASPALAAGRDPFDGVWRYDPAASSGGTAGQTLTISVTGNQETYFTEWTDQAGARTFMAFVVHYDGVPVPVYGYHITPDGVIAAQPITVVARETDNRHRTIEHWVGGRLFRRLERSASPDGHALISELTDFDAAGVVTRRAHLVFAAMPMPAAGHD
jgi:hypothetical protein